MADVSVATARTLLNRHMDDNLPNVSDQLFIDWMDFLNKFVWKKLHRTDPEIWLTKFSINTINGVSEYALPTDFRTVDSLGGGVFRTDDQNRITDDQLSQSREGSNQNGIWFKTGFVTFTPEPTQSTLFILKYIQKLDTLTSTSDITVIDEEFLEFIMQAMKKYFFEWDEDTFLESISDQRFVRLLEEYLDTYRQEAYIFLSEDITNSY